MEQETLFSSTVGVLAVILMIPVFFVWLEKKTRWKVFNFLPAIIWIFLTPIFLSNLQDYAAPAEGVPPAGLAPESLDACVVAEDRKSVV